MVFDIEMIQQVYAALPEKIDEIKNKLQRPLTLTEKILYTHLFKLCEFLARPRSNAGCNGTDGFVAVVEFRT